MAAELVHGVQLVHRMWVNAQHTGCTRCRIQLNHLCGTPSVLAYAILATDQPGCRADRSILSRGGATAALTILLSGSAEAPAR
jgi:hypothetical protein